MRSKGLLTIVLALLTVLAAPAAGWRTIAPGLLAAAAASMAIDAVILRRRDGAWAFPSGALLTGWIVAMVLSAQEPWYVTAITAAVGVVAKYVFRGRTANVFNPAALGLVATFYVFDTGQSWWGALPDLPLPALAVLIASGAFIASRVNKLPMVLAFLGGYFLLFTVTAYARDPRTVAEIFVAPDLHAVLYFAFFILTDPPTSPTRYPDQVRCAAVTAGVSYAVFMWLGVAYYLLAGVLAGNVWEAWRRRRRS